ncbi:Dyp-type peroxidase [Agarivorans sp. MS3-6]|uniref:Dyp-type peroxidase n=1 Tax=Agarivorans sp. TSD2052 TaxID=2937286 RepID=UPI00201023E2|nr:Dyp-type peroxidase [Agarivorans sp. TSD2052]UPW19969.1 Dyp-type peroxidase [Agarivorans sp. TSD2052]
MSCIQPQILKPVSSYACFLRFSLVDNQQLASCIQAFSALYSCQDSLVGFGAPLIAQLGKTIPEFKSANSIVGVNRTSPANQDDLWLRLSGGDPGQVMLRVQQWLDVLCPTFSINEQLDGFCHQGGKDLTGYEDGTENPEDNAESVVSLMGDKGMAGSSMLAVQKWQHQLKHFNMLPSKHQDNIIGRRKSDNVEFAESPPSAHVRRTAQESFTPEAFMLRRSLPWVKDQQCGLNFVCFANSLYPFEAQLKRMLGCEDGIEDGLFEFSRPLSTAYYWCPPVNGEQLDLSYLQR